MVTRARTEWRPNKQGYYTRQIGWKFSESTRRHFQHKFTLGRELTEAQWRENRLTELWQRFERSQSEQRPIWPVHLLDIAKQIAKGNRQYVVAMRSNEMPVSYAGRIQRLEADYPVVSYTAQNERAFEVGKECLRVLEGIEPNAEGVVGESIDVNHFNRYAAAERLLENAGLLATQPWWGKSSSVENQPAPRQRIQAAPTTPQNHMAEGDPGSLHMAMREYVRWLEDTLHDDSTDSISGWGNSQRRQTNRLIEHHQDRNLDTVGFECVDEMIRYWRGRPKKKGGTSQMKAKTCGHMISQLRRFFDWLHTSRFAWRKPHDYSEIRTTVKRVATDIQSSLEQVDTFSLAELILLNQYATPLERIWLLLGLNCGFGMAETASLLENEVRLFEAHEPRLQQILRFESTDEDSFIKRVRRKNMVYGEFILFQQTVQGIQWSIAKRRTQPNYGDDSTLFVNNSGNRYDKPTLSGNRNQQIPNAFSRLMKRVRDGGGEIRNLSFGKLRKTSGDFVRQNFGGEISGVFLCHGKAVDSDALADAYTNRPFGRVFEAIRAMEEHFAPVFEAAGADPFPQE